DEFWRFFGDTLGRRLVDAADANNFRLANGSALSNSGASAGITAASEAGNTVTITTSAASGFEGGEVGHIGRRGAGANGTVVITSVNTTHNPVTYTAPTSGLAPFSGSGATATLNTYQWYLDFDEDGNIDVGNTIDQAQFFNDIFKSLKA